MYNDHLQWNILYFYFFVTINHNWDNTKNTVNNFQGQCAIRPGHINYYPLNNQWFNWVQVSFPLQTM